MSGYAVELLGILIALALLIFLAFRGFSLLLAAPAAAIVAAAFSGEPLLAKWTLTFMQATGRFVTNFFPLFLLGGVFGKLMDDSGAALSIARAHHRTAGRAPRGHGRRAGLRGADLWRGQPVRRGVRRVPGRGRAVPAGGGSAPADPAGDRARRLHLHDDRAAGHAGHPERHSHGVFRRHAVRGARAWPPGVGDHAGLRPVVAGHDRIARPRRRREG